MKSLSRNTRHKDIRYNILIIKRQLVTKMCSESQHRAHSNLIPKST